MYIKKIVYTFLVFFTVAQSASRIVDHPIPSARMAAKGHQLYSNIVSGTLNKAHLIAHPHEYVHDIAALVFYFYSKAVQKGQGFSSGTFVIYDPGFRLYNFLYSYVKSRWTPNNMFQEILLDVSSRGAYPRKSTHFNNYYLFTKKAKRRRFRTIVKKKNFIHYGIDMPKTILLPAQKKHVLFGKVEIDPPLTFIKLEKHGLGKTGVLQHIRGLRESQIRKAIGKAVNLLHSKGIVTAGSRFDSLLKDFSASSSDDTADTRRENIPVTTLATFLGLLVADGSPFKKDEIEKGPIKAFGIQYMLKLANEYSKGPLGTPTWRAALSEFAQTIQKQYDHPTLRMGREVILKPGVELQIVRPA